MLMSAALGGSMHQYRLSPCSSRPVSEWRGSNGGDGTCDSTGTVDGDASRYAIPVHHAEYPFGLLNRPVQVCAD